MNASASDLRSHAKEILDVTARGEDVVVTFHGKPVARIIPFDSKKRSPGRGRTHKLFGIWKNDRRTADVDAYVRGIRKRRYA